MLMKCDVSVNIGVAQITSQWLLDNDGVFTGQRNKLWVMPVVCYV